MKNEQFQQIVYFLVPHLNTVFARRSFIALALGPTTPLKRHIDWHGKAEAFTVHLLDVCIQYGDNNGLAPIDQILAVAAQQLEADQAAQAQALRQVVAALTLDELEAWRATTPDEKLSHNTTIDNIIDSTVVIGKNARAITNIGRDQVINKYIEHKTIIQADSIAKLENLQPYEGDPPYKGLAYYTEKDAPFFFGREPLVDSIVQHLQNHYFLAVIGASGSGKSSLVRAGVIPIKRAQAWHIQVLRPGANPLTALALALTPDDDATEATQAMRAALAQNPATLGRITNEIASGKGHERMLLVIDQFEELFTLCKDETERAAFIANIVAVAQNKLVTTVMISMRADFYARCADYGTLRGLIATEQMFIGRMSESELIRAIVEPARVGGWVFVKGLVEQIVEDLGNAPGGLPLLSHALLETWARRRANVMVLSGYRASGGIEGAIALTADRTLDQLNYGEYREAKRIFMSLTQLGDGATHTRRPVQLAELTFSPDRKQLVESVLDRLASARLVTVDQAKVDVAHEALIHAWPKLREWLDENQDALRVQQRLQQAANEWEVEKDPGLLYRGLRLAEVEEWCKEQSEGLPPTSQLFLNASREQHEKEQALLAEQQAAQWLRRVAVILGVAAILLTLLVIQATRAGRLEMEARATAEAARAESERSASDAHKQAMAALAAQATADFNEQAAQHAREQAAQERDVATARELAIQSENALETDPELSLLLAQYAVQTTSADALAPIPQAHQALVKALELSRTRHTLGDHDEAISHAVYSSSGKWIASTSGDDTAKIWDAATGEVYSTIFTDTQDLLSIDLYDRDGRFRVAVSGHTDLIRLWEDDLTAEPRILPGAPGGTWDLAFHPNGETLASAGRDGTVRIWRFTTGREVAVLRGHEEGAEVANVSFSADGRWLVSSGSDGKAVIWNVKERTVHAELVGHALNVARATFSPNDRYVVTASFDHTARVWHVATGRQIALLAGHSDAVEHAVFAPNGRQIATSGADHTIRFWDFPDDSAEIPSVLVQTDMLRGHTDRVWALAFHPEGHSLLSGSRDATMRIWSVALPRQETTIYAHSAEIHGIAINPDGSRIATASADKTVRIWSTQSKRRLRTLRGHSADVFDVAFSPDGERLITSSWDGTLRVWNPETGSLLKEINAHEGPVYGVAYHPKGFVFASAGEDFNVRVWDAETFEEVSELPHESGVWDVAFSPDGTQLIAAVHLQKAVLWDWVYETELEEYHDGGHTEWGVKRVAFHPDGGGFATSGNDRSVRIWASAHLRAVASLLGYRIDEPDDVWGLAYSPDGAHLATGGLNGVVTLWDGQHAPLGEWQTGAIVRDLAWMPDGQRLVIGEADGTVRIYLLSQLLDFETLWELSHERVTRRLTSAECTNFLHRTRCDPPRQP